MPLRSAFIIGTPSRGWRFGRLHEFIYPSFSRPHTGQCAARVEILVAQPGQRTSEPACRRRPGGRRAPSFRTDDFARGTSNEQRHRGHTLHTPASRRRSPSRTLGIRRKPRPARGISSSAQPRRARTRPTRDSSFFTSQSAIRHYAANAAKDHRIERRAIAARGQTTVARSRPSALESDGRIGCRVGDVSLVSNGRWRRRGSGVPELEAEPGALRPRRPPVFAIALTGPGCSRAAARSFSPRRSSSQFVAAGAAKRDRQHRERYPPFSQ